MDTLTQTASTNISVGVSKCTSAEGVTKFPTSPFSDVKKSIVKRLEPNRDVRRHNFKPNGLRIGCESSSYVCEGQKANTLDNKGYT